MSDATADEEADAVNAFLREALHHRQGEGLRPLPEYQERHRAHAAAIARVYAELGSGLPSVPPPAGPRLSQWTLGAFLDARPGNELVQAEAFARRLAEDLTDLESIVPAPPDPGERFGPYRILGEIGRGGQGIVFHAEDTRLPRVVALKLLHSRDREFAQAFARFRREAETASRLDHPGICTVYETGVIEGVPFIAMRRVEGEVLSKRFERLHRSAAGAGPLKADILGILRLFEQAARALHAAHEAGFVHRDVKPGNIMVTPDGQPVILDFGLAREDAAGAAITLTGDALGTPAYMAPEQLGPSRGTRVDRRADVWSLGVALYEGVCGRRPFEGATREGLFRAILSDAVPDARQRNPAVGRDLGVVLQTAIEKDPDRRYRTAAALADDLRAVLDGRPILARPVGSFGRLLRWSRREPAKAALVLALPLLATLITIRVMDLDRIRSGRLAQIEIENDETLSEAACSERDPVETLPLFESVLARDGTSPEAAAQAAAGIVLAHLRLRQPEPALRALDRHADVLGDRASVRLLRMDALQALGRTTEVHVSQEHESLDAFDHFVLGTREVKAGDEGDASAWSRAFHHATHAVALSPKPRLSYVTLRIRAASNVQNRDALLESAAVLMARWPKAWSAWFYCGSGLANLGTREWLDDAIAVCQEAIREKPEDTAAHRDLGKLLADKRLFKGAIQAFQEACREAIRQRPEDSAAHFNISFSLVSSGRTDQAIWHLEQAIKFDPSCSKAHNHLGLVFRQQGLPGKAIEAFDKAIELNPAHATAHYNRGNLLADQNLLDAAVQAYDEAIRHQPDYAKAHNNRGYALARMGRLGDAIASYRNAILVKPDHATAHANLGRALADTHQLIDAIKHFKESIRLKPDVAEVRVRLAYALQARGVREEAISAFEAAIKVDPESAEAHCDLGNALRMPGRYRKALHHLRRGNELGTARPGWPHRSWEWVAEVVPLAECEEALEAHLAQGTSPGTAAELIECAKMALDRNEALVAAGWYRAALEQDPSLSENPMDRHRAEAASAAVRASALAACEDAAPWRNQALRYLESELAAIEGRLERQRIREDWVESTLQTWKGSPDLAPVRDHRIEELPENERAGWRALWRRVDENLGMD